MLVFEAGSWAKYGAKCGLKSRTLKHKQGTPEIVHRSYPSLNLLFVKEKYLGISQKLVGLEQTDFKQYVFKLWNSLLLNDSACWKFAWVQKEIESIGGRKIVHNYTQALLWFNLSMSCKWIESTTYFEEMS